MVPEQRLRRGSRQRTGGHDACGKSPSPGYRHRRYRPLSRTRRGVNTAHAHRRGPGERANAELKGWKILRKIRASPSRTTTLVQPAQPLILVG